MRFKAAELTYALLVGALVLPTDPDQRLDHGADAEREESEVHEPRLRSEFFIEVVSEVAETIATAISIPTEPV